MNRLLLLAALCAVSGAAHASHQAPNLAPFKTVCVSGNFEDQGQPDPELLGGLLGQLAAALGAAGIAVDASCDLEGGVGDGTQLNLFYTFVSTRAGTAFDAALEGWLATAGPFRDVTVWRDSYFGTLEVGSGAQQAAGSLDELMVGFAEDWTSVH